MTCSTPQHDLPTVPRGLAARFAALGIPLVGCDVSGEIIDGPARGEDWLTDLCCQAPLARHALRDAARRWNDQDDPVPVESLPGLWFTPQVVHARRRRVGYSVGIVVTERLLEDEPLAALCQGAGLDLRMTRTLLMDLPPASCGDVDRFIALVRYAHEDQRQMITDRAASESVGKQLADSYEEINLLYTIIQSMSVAQKPSRFVSATCEELLETLPYRWIGAQFIDDRSLLRELAGRFVLAGDTTRSRRQVERLARQLLPRVAAGSPLVVEPATQPGDAVFWDLGRAVLVHPISRGQRVIGAMIAGDKQGEDLAASSVDMKLLGAAATHMAMFLENAALYEDLNAMFVGTLEALTASIDAKDRYTCGHSLRVAHLTEQLARAVGVDEAAAARMRIAGLVHDVGKIGVPEAVLTKPGRLDAGEFEWIRRHPEIGYRILKDIPQLEDILPGVLYHHERWDGTGYPAGLAGADIPRIARIIALADAFDAMSSTRTYRAALTRSEVLREIENRAGEQFDPDFAPVFARLDFSEFDRLVREHRAQGPDRIVEGEAA